MNNPKWKCDNLQRYQKLIEKVEFQKVLTSFYNFDSYLPDDDSERELEKNIRIKEYDDFLNFIKSRIAQVYMITGEPKGIEFNPTMALRKNLPGNISEESARSNYTEHSYALKKLKNLDGVELMDPITHLCKDGVCNTRDNEHGFFYRDDNHMRPWYSIKHNSYLNIIFSEKTSALSASNK